MTNTIDLSNKRRVYESQGVRRADLAPDPFEQFAAWYQQADEAGILDPHAMSLTTVSAHGVPSIRTVLMKYLDQDGLVFYTNLESAKARDIGENPNVAALFLWRDLNRQVIVQGTAERISTARSLKYFLSRPRDSQLGAWVSRQSSVISSRRVLEEKMLEMKHRFADGDISLPSFWGGYTIRPRRFEFWQGRPSRLHDRFEYLKDSDGHWKISRLAP